jgi:V8-like Glu-specific endopeptidase
MLENASIGGRGTGFMISPCYLITNYHVVRPKDAPPGSGGPENIVGNDVGFVAGHPATPFRGKVVRAGNYNLHQDWAVVRFDAPNCPGARSDIGYFGLQNSSLASIVGYRAVLAGFPEDHDFSHITVEWGCRITAEEDLHRWAYSDCSVRGGSSGSPVLILGRDGIPHVLAIAFNEGDERQSGIVNFGSPSTATRLIAIDEPLIDIPARHMILDDLKGATNPLRVRILEARDPTLLRQLKSLSAFPLIPISISH